MNYRSTCTVILLWLSVSVHFWQIANRNILVNVVRTNSRKSLKIIIVRLKNRDYYWLLLYSLEQRSGNYNIKNSQIVLFAILWFPTRGFRLQHKKEEIFKLWVSFNGPVLSLSRRILRSSEPIGCLSVYLILSSAKWFAFWFRARRCVHP